MTILNRLPRHKNCVFYNIIIFILSLVSIVPIFMPVVLGHLSDYTKLDLENGVTKTYIIIRFLFGLTAILALFASAFFKQYLFYAVPIIFGFIMSSIKLIHNIDQYKTHYKFAEIMNQPLENNAVLKNDGIYILMCSLFLLLALSSLMYILGIPHTSLFVMLFSVTAAICAAFVIYTEAVTCEIFTEGSMASGLDRFRVISFTFSVPTALIPTFIALNTAPAEKKKKYTPKRMKR